MADDDRRKLENELTFREANERLRSTQAELGVDDERVPFICECHDVHCRTVVLLAPAEYMDVRARDCAFFVAPDHEGDDDVVATFDRYTIVEKLADG
jgi:hypothetical protein